MQTISNRIAALGDVYGDGLAGDLASTADWRLRKAEEYPEDDRNMEAAKLLTTLAEGVLSLGNDHPLVAR